MLKFGDCYINETKTSTLTLTNHHASDCVRFVWPDHPNLTFKPKVGHLHAGCTKEVSVSFTCEKALSLEEAEVAAWRADSPFLFLQFLPSGKVIMKDIFF